MCTAVRVSILDCVWKRVHKWVSENVFFPPFSRAPLLLCTSSLSAKEAQPCLLSLQLETETWLLCWKSQSSNLKTQKTSITEPLVKIEPQRQEGRSKSICHFAFGVGNSWVLVASVELSGDCVGVRVMPVVWSLPGASHFQFWPSEPFCLS